MRPIKTILGLALVVAAALCATPPRSMRMYVFDCATLKDRDPATYGLTRQQVESVDMSDPCFLIVHPRGTLLWETGLNDAVYNRPEGGGAKHDKIDKSLKSQLAAVGYQPKDITYLAISHLHGDHSGNANDYAGSTWIAQKAERDYMFSQGLPANIHPDEYAALKNSKTKLITGDYDVFGDGSVMLILTPGHTPGHQSLLVKLPKTGAVMFGFSLFPPTFPSVGFSVGRGVGFFSGGGGGGLVGNRPALSPKLPPKGCCLGSAASPAARPLRAFRGIQPQPRRQARQVVAQGVFHGLKKLIAAVVAERRIAERPGKRDVTVVPLQQAHGRLKNGVALVDGLGALMHAGTGQVLRNHLEADPLLGHANPQIVIERKVHVRIEPAAAVGGSANKRRRLANEAVPLQNLRDRTAAWDSG